MESVSQPLPTSTTTIPLISSPSHPSVRANGVFHTGEGVGWLWDGMGATSELGGCLQRILQQAHLLCGWLTAKRFHFGDSISCPKSHPSRIAHDRANSSLPFHKCPPTGISGLSSAPLQPGRCPPVCWNARVRQPRSAAVTGTTGAVTATAQKGVMREGGERAANEEDPAGQASLWGAPTSNPPSPQDSCPIGVRTLAPAHDLHTGVV